MKNVTLTLFVSSLSFFCSAQDSVTMYYSNRNFDQLVEPAKAKYTETVIRDKGAVTTTRRDLKKNLIIYRHAEKGGEPIGVWITAIGKGLEERDYNFDLKYGKEECVNPSVLQGIPDFMQDNVAIQYSAPKLATGETNILEFIRKRLRYPAYARRNGIEGAVEMAFTITREGNIEDIIVTKGVHVSLDKESVRVIRQVQFSNPPMINGEPQDVCVKAPIAYRLN